jgi:hypothetical protein
MFTSDYVRSQLVYFARVNAAAIGGLADIAAQFGPGLLTGTNAASIYTFTMPVNFTVPLTRRMLKLTPIGAAGTTVGYNHAGSADNTVIVNGWAAAGGVADSAFMMMIYRLELMP